LRGDLHAEVRSKVVDAVAAHSVHSQRTHLPVAP
jgi:hypothetical protein